MSMQIGTAISGPAMAIIYDLAGSYFWSWVMLSGFGLVITICLVLSFYLTFKAKANYKGEIHDA